MKAIKYFFIGALMTVISAPAMAQSTISDAIKVVKSNVTVKEKEAAIKAAKFNKKDAKTAIEIGRAYLSAADTLSARKYAEIAKKADKTNGDAYILLGDIEAYSDNAGEAASWYEQAIYFDKNNEKAYIKYAQVNSYSSPTLAVQKLEELRAIRPDFPVDAEAAHIYYNVAVNKGKSSLLTDALNHYKKVEKSKLEKGRLTEYALVAYLLQDHKTSLEVAQYGLQGEPRNAGFNRLSLYNNADLSQFEEAVPYINRLFNESDSVKLTMNDYKYAGYALQGAKKYDEAISYFEKQIAEAGENKAEVATAVKNISDCYKSMGDVKSSLAKFEEYLTLKENATANDYAGLATLYRGLAADQTGAEQEASVKKAITVYETMIEKFPTSADYSNFMAARTISALDADQKKGLAKPYYEKLAESIEAAGVKDASDKARITEAYSYLGIYYFKIKDDAATAKPYFEKLQNVDPENALAKQVLETYK